MFSKNWTKSCVAILSCIMLCVGLNSGCENTKSQVEMIADSGGHLEPSAREPVVKEPSQKEPLLPDAIPPELTPKDTARNHVTPAKPKRYEGGQCPIFKAGSNTIEAEFNQRTFQLFLPPKPKGAPLLFVWHPLGGNADQMIRSFSVAEISKKFGAIVAVPSSCCSGPKRLPCCSRASEWSFVQDFDIDLSFFDGMLSCLDKQYDIDNKRVYTTGFSAGALWSSLLVLYRSTYLASAAIFSGGVGLFEYSKPEYPMPVLLAWGGSKDLFGGGSINFEKMTKSFEEKLKKDKHFVISCNHGLGHSVPRGAGAWAFPFLFDHVFGSGESPYKNKEKQKGFPNYCKFP